MVQDRAVVTMADRYKVVHAVLIGAVFDTLNDP